MPRAKTAATPAVETKPRRSAPVAERKRTPVRRKTATLEFDPAAHYDEIAAAAYLNFLARAGTAGSSEEDWFIAETTVRAKYVS
jgi:hypothetical protein